MKDDQIRRDLSTLQKRADDLVQLDINELETVLDGLQKIHGKLPHQNKVCHMAFDKAMVANDLPKAARFFAAGYLAQEIFHPDQLENSWTNVLDSKFISIDNTLYLFPNIID